MKYKGSTKLSLNTITMDEDMGSVVGVLVYYT